MARARRPFEERRELGRGASGRVVLAKWLGPRSSLRTGQQVAIKLIHEQASDELRASFLAERQLGQSLEHPALAPVLAAGKDWFAMPYYPGDVNQLLREQGPLEGEHLLRLARTLAAGLAELHSQGWLHGDVKLENVRLDENGVAHWIDLGFATGIEERPSRSQGSPRWLSPEELRGRPRTTASEVFSLGIMCYALATGEHPFAPEDEAVKLELADLLERFERRRATRPSVLAPLLAAGFEALLETMLHPDPDSRPTAGEVEHTLSKLPLSYPQPSGHCPFGPPEQLPTVGRSREFQVLWKAWKRTQSRSGGSAIWIEGPEGAGVSRFGDEFARRARRSEDPPLLIRARASRYADARPLHPILDLLRAWLQAPEGRPLGSLAKERLSLLVPRASAKALILALDSSGARPIVPEHLVRWLSAVGRNQRLIVFLDDADLAGGGSLDLLERVARGLSSSRLLLLLGRQTGRQAQNQRALKRLEERLLRVGRASAIALSPYDLAAVTQLVESTFAPDTPVRSIARALLERSGGWPSQLTELTKALESQGAIARGPAGWSVLDAPLSWPHPESTTRLLEARFAALPLEERLWLQRFAIAGQRLEPEFLAHAFGHTTALEVARWLEGFTRAGWLERNGPRYHFARGSLRPAVWRSTRKERRARLHRRVATALESLGLGQQEPLELAFHLRNAGEHQALLEHLKPRLASLAMDQPARRVQTLTQWGLEALEQVNGDIDLQAELLTRGADAAHDLGRRTQQRELLDRLTDLDLDEKHNPDLVARVYLQHGRFAAERGSFGLARGLLRNARMIAEGANNPELVHAARLARGEVNLECGAHHEAREDLYSILGAKPAPQPTLLARTRLSMGLVDLLDDHFERALAAADQAESDLGEDARPAAQGLRVRALLLRARIDRILGRSSRAWESLSAAQRLAPRAGERRLEIEIASRRGRLLLEHGHEHEAELELREATWQAREMEDAHGRATAELFLGILLAERGDPEGGRVLERVREDLGQQGLRRLQALAEALTARAALQGGQLEEAKSRAELALRQLELYGAELQDRIVIEGTAALVAQAQGHSSQRRAHQKRALQRIQREVGQIQDHELASSLRRAAATYMRAAFTLEGPVYPRRSTELLRPNAN